MRFDEILGLLPRMKFALNDGSGLRLFSMELGYWAVVILLTLAFVRFRPALLDKAEARLRQLSQFKRFWLAAFAIIIVVLRLALLPFIPVPTPVVHDEYSYILASDTFAHGRLTNPHSPMWQHFESFHINVQPTYQSMYPPAQGLALAVGQILTGNPWIGVVLSTALMCSAIYWMLLGWLPAPWAWLGGALASVRFGVFSYWINSYWGGSVAAIGGALVLGSLPRLRERPTARIGLLLAAGLLILANSRPLEGFLFSIPILLSVVLILIENGKAAWRESLKAALPGLVLLAAGSGWMLYYNWRGTGNPLLMPYVVNLITYHITKPFFFQAPFPVPSYGHQSMRAFYVYHELPDLMVSKFNMNSLIAKRLSVYYTFYLWPFLLLVAPCVVAIWRSRLRVVLFSLALVGACLLAQMWDPRPHYAAPVAGALFLVLLFSLRHFRNSPSPYALWGSRAVAIVFAFWMISPIGERLRDPLLVDPIVRKADLARHNILEIKSFPLPKEYERARMESVLEARGGKHLVIVHHPRFDIPDLEWVYNDADLDGARVVWARDMGEVRNKELLKYYPDRQAWYVDHGSFIPQLLPYNQGIAQLRLASDGPPSEIALPGVANALRGLSYQPTATAAKPQLSAAVSQ